MTGQTGLISVDWGTSSFRAYRLAADGTVIDRRETAEGILAVPDRDFERILVAAVSPWVADQRTLPILMSGMIGSRQGWVEVPYLSCPANAAAVAAGLCHVEVADLAPVMIVPGLITQDAGGVPDVMRGEETQIFGALATTGQHSGLFVLPGTHSKWVRVEAGSITDFATYMTGEVYAALRRHSILGRLMSGDEVDPAGFSRGVASAQWREGGPGQLLHHIFSARTLALVDRLPSRQVAGYLSGLLIGAEMSAAARQGDTITIVASAELAVLYANAARQLGLDVRTAPADCVAAGHLVLADAAQLEELPRDPA